MVLEKLDDGTEPVVERLSALGRSDFEKEFCGKNRDQEPVQSAIAFPKNEPRWVFWLERA